MRLSAAGSLILLLFFCSCVKTENPQPLPQINEVSGKTKRVSAGIEGSRRAVVSDFTYDSAGRVKTYKRVSNDSTLNPMITASDYYTFTYNLGDPKPVSAIHTNHNGTVNETTYYSYDTHNRVISEEKYNGGVLIADNQYNYLTSIFTRVTSYGSPYMAQTIDTAWLDSSRNILKMKTYSLTSPGTPPLASTLTYDKKKNPMGETNVGIFVKTFAVQDRTMFNLTPNNFLTEEGNINVVPFNTAVYYEYSTNGFPIRATMANNTTSVFEYE